MKIVIDGYNKSIHKKDNQIVIHEKTEILDSIKVCTECFQYKNSKLFYNTILCDNVIYK